MSKRPYLVNFWQTAPNGRALLVKSGDYLSRENAQKNIRKFIATGSVNSWGTIHKIGDSDCERIGEPANADY